MSFPTRPFPGEVPAKHEAYARVLKLWSIFHSTEFFLYNRLVSWPLTTTPLDLLEANYLYSCLRIAIEITEHAEHAHAMHLHCLLQQYNLVWLLLSFPFIRSSFSSPRNYHC